MKIINSLFTLSLFALSCSCFSEDKTSSQDWVTVYSDKEVDPVFDFGLILDETISKPGADFYKVFNLHWQPATKEVVTVKVQEQLDFLRSNFILLWFDDELVFRQRLPLRGDEIDAIAKKAVKQLNNKLLQNKFIQTELD
jgi:hypothetical protein